MHKQGTSCYNANPILLQSNPVILLSRYPLLFEQSNRVGLMLPNAHTTFPVSDLHEAGLMVRTFRLEESDSGEISFILRFVPYF